MKNIGYLYTAVGIVGFLGALVAGYVNFTVGEALGMISTQPAPAEVDISALQAQAQALAPVIMLAWVWIIAVLACSAVSIYFGVLMIRDRVSVKR